MKGLCSVVLLTALVAFTTPVCADAPMSPLRRLDTPNPKAGSTPSATPVSSPAAPAKPPTAQAPDKKANDAVPKPANAARSPTAGAVRESAVAGLVKPGRWQFTTHLVSSAQSSSVAGLEPPPATHGAAAPGIGSSYTDCVGDKDVVPAAFGAQCNLDSENRSGSMITWSMTCSQTHVHLQGVAQYHGDTMQATVLSQLPKSGGTVTNLTQRITGHYLGACRAEAAVPPGKASAATAAAVAHDEGTAAAAPPGEAEGAPHPAMHLERRHYVRRYARRRYPHYHAGWGSLSSIARGASFGGPSPYSNGGP